MKPGVVRSDSSSWRARYGLLLALCLVVGGLGLIGAMGEAEGQMRGNRSVRFQLVVENPADELTDQELRSRRHQEMARMVAERIEHRLETIGVGDYRVEVMSTNDLEVRVYGRYSTGAIKSAVIPAGRLEIRPVVIDDTPWRDLEEMLPEGVEIRNEPGSFQSDRLYLYSPDARRLTSFLGRVAVGQKEMMVFPHQEGWRTLALGATLATEEAVEKVELERTPSAIPFVRMGLKGEAVDRIRAGGGAQSARHLAIVLDGEIVTLVRFSERTFTSEVVLEVPEYLRTVDARNAWGLQVAGRLAAPIPVVLAEMEER